MFTLAACVLCVVAVSSYYLGDRNARDQETERIRGLIKYILKLQNEINTLKGVSTK